MSLEEEEAQANETHECQFPIEADKSGVVQPLRFMLTAQQAELGSAVTSTHMDDDSDFLSLPAEATDHLGPGGVLDDFTVVVPQGISSRDIK